MTGEIGPAVGSGLRWSFAGAVVGRTVRLLTGIIVARLLFPEDFGVYAVALAAINLLMTVNDLGLIPAIIQWRGRFEDIRPTATTLTLTSSALLYAGCFVLAPAFSTAMGAPEAAGVVRLLTLEILVDGVTAVSVATLMRTFQQNRLAQAELASLPVLVGLTIGLAAAGAGPWALAGGHLAANVVTAVLVLRAARALVRPGFDRAVAKRLLSFGLPLAGGFLVEAVLLNADYLVIGAALGPTALGLYLLAFNVSSWPTGLLIQTVRRVSIAGFSRLAEGTELAHGFVRSFGLLVAAALPISLVLGVMAPALVGFVYGDRWLGAAGPLRFLAILAVARLCVTLISDALLAAGLPWRTFWLQVAWAVVLIPALLVGVRANGAEGVAAAHAVVGMAVAVPLGLWGIHSIGIDVKAVLRALVRPALAGGVTGMVLIVLASAVSGRFLQLAVGGVATLVVYTMLLAGPPAVLASLRTRSLAPVIERATT